MNDSNDLDTSVKDKESLDIHFGRILRSKREILGLSQKDLADELGISSQQLSKYEKGLNRISAGNIYHVSLILKEPACNFFSGLPSQSQCHHQPISLSDEHTPPSKEAHEILRIFYSINNSEIRKKLKETIKAIAKIK